MSEEFLRIDTGSQDQTKTLTLFNLVDENNPILRTVPEDFNFNNPQMHPGELVHRLYQTMRHYKGLGLSAIQVGVPVKVFVVGTDEQHQAFFNPEIVVSSEEKLLDSEGCLSYPMLFLNVQRAKEIDAIWQNEKGVWLKGRFSGLTARLIQHEVDHCNGILFTERVPALSLKIKQEKRRKTMKKIMRKVKAMKKLEAADKKSTLTIKTT